MAIFGEGFVDRLNKFALIPEKEIGEYGVYGDFTVSRKSFLDAFDPFIPKIFAATKPQFNQIEELHKALSTLQAEIQKNDYALLANDQVQKSLPRVIQNLKAIKVLDTSCKIFFKFQELQLIIMAHFPLTTTDKGTELSREALHKYCKYEKLRDLNEDLEESRELLLKELMEKNPENVTSQTLALLKRIVIYTKDLHFVHSSDKKKELFERFINHALYTLLSRDVLIPEEEDFLKFIIGGENYLRGQYANFVFCTFIESKLKEIFKNDKSSEQKLIQFSTVLTVYQKFLTFQQTHFKHKRCETISLLERKKKKIFIQVLKDLTKIVRIPEMKEILKQLFIKNNQIDSTDSILQVAIRDAHFEDYRTLKDVDESQPIPKDTPLAMSKFHEAGLLVPEEGGTLRLSDEWEELMNLLGCDIFSRFTFLFLHYERLPSEDPRHKYYVSFLMGSSLLKYPDYFIRQSLRNDPARFLITRMANLNLIESRKLVPIILEKNLSLKSVSILLGDSHKSNNQILIDCARQYLSKAISYKFITGPIENETLDIPEGDFIEIVKLMNIAEIEQQCRSDEEHRFLTLHLKMFPNLTLNVFNALLEKFPTLHVEGFDTKRDSNLCDVILTDENGINLYMNKALLSRSSEYFKALFSKAFKEGNKISNEKEIVVVEEGLDVIVKWMPVILHPMESKLLEEVSIKIDLIGFVNDLHIARSFQMLGAFNIMDEMFSRLIMEHHRDLSSAYSLIDKNIYTQLQSESLTNSKTLQAARFIYAENT